MCAPQEAEVQDITYQKTHETSNFTASIMVVQLEMPPFHFGFEKRSSIAFRSSAYPFLKMEWVGLPVNTVTGK